MKLSVCMATYNGARFIKEQIDSILSQLSASDELIISDDGSKDETCSIIETYNDSRIVLLHNEQKHGFIGNFENALKHASGDFIFLSDQDDVWKNNKVKVVVENLKYADLIVHDADMVDGQLQSLGKDYYSTLHHHSGFLANLYKNRFLGCCMAFNRKVLDAVLPFPKHISGHDYWIGMYSLLHFKVRFIQDSLMYYRRHGNNLSPSGEKSNASLYEKLVVKRLGIVRALLFR